MSKQTLRPPNGYVPDEWGFFISKSFFSTSWRDTNSPGNMLEAMLFSSVVFKTRVEETVDFMKEESE